MPDDVVWPDADTAENPGSTILSDAADALRTVGGGAYKGTGAMVRGIGKAAQVIGDYTTTPAVNFLTGQQHQTRNLLDPAADALGSIGENLQAGASPASKEAVKQSTPGGDLFDPSTWSFGEDPSLRGYLLHGADILGQMVPVVASAVATAGAGPSASMIAGGAAGGAQGGGAAVEEARKAVDDLAAKGKIRAESTYYRKLLDEGHTPDEALARTRDAAEKWAFVLTTPISALGGAASGALIHPASNIVSRGNLLARVAGRGTLGAAEEGAQEVAESIETKTGINLGAGTKESLTEGTFADFVLGALGGAGPAATGGALSRREAAPAQAASGHAVPEDTVFPEEVPGGGAVDRETASILLDDSNAAADIRSEMERARNAERVTEDGDVPPLDRKLLRKRGYGDDEISAMPPEQLDALVADVVEKPAEMMPASVGEEPIEAKAQSIEGDAGLSQDPTPGYGRDRACGAPDCRR